jgi:hypothetical protein
LLLRCPDAKYSEKCTTKISSESSGKCLRLCHQPPKTFMLYTCNERYKREREKGSAAEFQVHARETNLVGEPNAEAEQHAPDDEHGDVHGRAGHDAAGEEEGATHEHDGLPAHHPGHAGGHERRHQPGHVQGRREGRQRLAVVDAVLVALRRRHPLEDVREEALQERLHFRDAALN